MWIPRRDQSHPLKAHQCGTSGFLSHWLRIILNQQLTWKLLFYPSSWSLYLSFTHYSHESQLSGDCTTLCQARLRFLGHRAGLCLSHHEPVSRSLPLSRSSSSLWDCDTLSVPPRARLARAPSATPFIWTPPEQHVLQAGDTIWI